MHWLWCSGYWGKSDLLGTGYIRRSTHCENRWRVITNNIIVTDTSLQESRGIVRSTECRQGRCDKNKGQSRVAFKNAYWEILLVSASYVTITISRNGGQCLSRFNEITCSPFDISLMGSSRTDLIPCNIADASEFTLSALVIEEDKLNAPQTSCWCSSKCNGKFKKSVVLSLYYNVEISHSVQGQSTLSRSFVSSYKGEHIIRDANNQLEFQRLT